jgi:hypothetical protein
MNNYVNQIFKEIQNTADNIIDIIQTIREYQVMNNNQDTHFSKPTPLNPNGIYIAGMEPDERNRRLNTISIQLASLSEILLIIFVKISNLLVLRRILDKEYITHSVYCGSFYQSLDIIFQLVKNYDFKITNASFSKVDNIAQLNEDIKSRDNFISIYPLLVPPKWNQCSSIDNFPNNFM